MGSGGALLDPQQGPGRNHGRNQTFKHCHDIGEPRFLQLRKFTGGGSGIF